MNLAVFHMNNITTLKEIKKSYAAFEKSILATKLLAECIIIIENLVSKVVFLNVSG